MLRFQDKLLSIARPVAFREGERLVRQGEPSRGAFLIRAGVVEAQVAMPGGGTMPVAELRDGEMFGETALVERGACSASVVAKTALEGWFVGRDDFRALVASRDGAALEIQREITRVLAARLRVLNAKVREHPAAEDRPLRNAPAQSTRQPPSFEWRTFLPALPFFEGFDAEETRELLDGARAFELGRGATLFSPGDAAEACHLVLRGAVEIYAPGKGSERRIAVAGPGELVGYLSVIEGAAHSAAARVRDRACLLEWKAARFVALYRGDSATSVSLQHAIHLGLLRALGRTNTQLTRLVAHARLSEASKDIADLEQALHGQL